MEDSPPSMDQIELRKYRDQKMPACFCSQRTYWTI